MITYVKVGQLLFTLAIILLGIKLKLKAGLALILGSLVLVFLPIPKDYGFIPELLQEFCSEGSINLLLVLGLFGYYNNILRNSLGMEMSLAYLRRKVSNLKILFFFIPTVLGWLINPGGVVLSLQAVEELLPAGNKAEKAGICMFFRHVQYPILPIQPALMLLAAQSGIGFPRYFLANLPIVVMAVGAGYWVYLRKYRIVPQQEEPCAVQHKIIWGTLGSLAAIMIIAVVTHRLELALAVGIIVFLMVAGTSHLNIVRDLDKDLILLGMGFILYRYGISLRIDSIISALGTESVLIINLVLPGVTALISGSCLLGVGCALPVLLASSLVKGISSFQILYFSSLLGYYFSPVHLCSVLAREYAEIKLLSWYGVLFRPFLIIGVGLILYFMVSR